jgi:hypothetical protein
MKMVLKLVTVTRAYALNVQAGRGSARQAGMKKPRDHGSDSEAAGSNEWAWVELNYRPHAYQAAHVGNEFRRHSCNSLTSRGDLPGLLAVDAVIPWDQSTHQSTPPILHATSEGPPLRELTNRDKMSDLRGNPTVGPGPFSPDGGRRQGLGARHY